MSRFVEWLPQGSLPPPSVASRALLNELAPLVDGRASSAARERLAYARDLWPKALLWSTAGRIPAPPEIVVWPGSVEQTAAVVRKARALGVPVVPYGGGTGLCGGTLALKGGIALDLKRLNRLSKIDLEALEADCEAGMLGEVLERKLNRVGLTSGHYPGSLRCSTVGGWISTGSAGQCSGRYGSIEDRLVSVTAVDGTGEVMTSRRPSGSWDAARLLIGSEGCFAAICSARLALAPLPEERAFQSFRFGSLEAGIEALRAVLRAGIRPAIARLYDPFDSALMAQGWESRPLGRRGPARAALDERVLRGLRRAASLVTLGQPFGWAQASRLLRGSLMVLVLEGPADLCELEAEEAARICASAGGEELGPEPARGWWERRYDAGFRQAAVFDSGAFTDTLDVAGTWDRAAQIYRSVRQALAPLAFAMGHFSHARSEGCSITVTFVATAAGPAQRAERHEEIWRRALAAAAGAGATGSHRHGVGLAKLNALKGELGDGMRLVRALKANFDPDGILNPGKLGT